MKYLPGKEDRLYGVEVSMQQVSVLLRVHVAHTVVYAQLDASHQLGSFKLFVRDLTVLLPPVSQLLALK